VDYEKKLNDIEVLISSNQALCERIVAHAMEFYGIKREEFDNHTKEAEKNKRLADKVSVIQTLKHFVRDWADEGAHERNDAFPCILSMISGLQLVSSETTAPVKVLLPGSGLGRLAHEIARLDGMPPNFSTEIYLSRPILILL
jgi:carnosine N-methyltransferase